MTVTVQNVFVITRVCYIGLLSHTFYYGWGDKNHFLCTVLQPPVGPGCNPDITGNRKLYSLKWGFVTSGYYRTVESLCFEPPWKKQSGWNYSVKLAKGI